MWELLAKSERYGESGKKVVLEESLKMLKWRKTMAQIGEVTRKVEEKKNK